MIPNCYVESCIKHKIKLKVCAILNAIKLALFGTCVQDHNEKQSNSTYLQSLLMYYVPILPQTPCQASLQESLIFRAIILV